MPVPCVCVVCSVAFTLPPSAIRQGKGRYCSRQCWRLRERKTVSCVCQECQRVFPMIPSDVKQGKGKYCSTYCYHQSTITPLADRFWSYVLKTEDCWLWQGAILSNGYGAFSFNSTKQVRAHRMSYELTFGLLLPGMLCLHRCDRADCVRPDHLFIGTFRDNTQDMFNKGRNGLKTHPERFAPGVRKVTHTENIPRGEQKPQAKLTEEKVREIRQLHETEQWTRRRLAAFFGVSHGVINRILHGIGWKHVN